MRTVLVILASVLAIGVAPAQAAAPASAWQVLPLANATPKRSGLQHLAIQVDAARLREIPTELSLPLPQRLLHAHLVSVEQHGRSGFNWRGTLTGIKDGKVTLSVSGNAVAGLIDTVDAQWELVPAGDDGQGWLIQVDPDAFPPEQDAQPQPGPMALAPRPADSAQSSDAAEQTDVLVLYSPAARDAAGGDSAITAQALAAADAANLAFSNSGMRARFRVVGVELLPGWVEGTQPSSGDELALFRQDATQQARRNALGADLVSLLVNELPCGIGYVMRYPSAGFADWAVQITDRDCAVGNLSWAHEHGHNMGFEHDPDNGESPANASYVWSFGHYVEDPGGNSFRTIMSYGCPAGGCTRRAYFSNPDVTYAGFPTGIADQRDNARTGDLTGDIVANFRQAIVDLVFCSGFESGESGGACLPARR